MSDDARTDLIADCARLIDNGLAPLVAAGLIKPTLAAVVASSLKVGVFETSGTAGRDALSLMRTFKAIETVGYTVEAAKQMGGA